jgi:hypothetical protein
MFSEFLAAWLLPQLAAWRAAPRFAEGFHRAAASPRPSHLFEPIPEARSKRACVVMPGAESVTMLKIGVSV